METNAIFYVVAIPAVLFAEIYNGGFGQAVAFAATLLLTLVPGRSPALALMLSLLIVMDFTSLPPYRVEVERPS